MAFQAIEGVCREEDDEDDDQVLCCGAQGYRNGRRAVVRVMLMTSASHVVLLVSTFSSGLAWSGLVAASDDRDSESGPGWLRLIADALQEAIDQFTHPGEKEKRGGCGGIGVDRERGSRYGNVSLSLYICVCVDMHV